MVPDSPSERFPKRFRLVRQREFDRVFQCRTSARDGMLIIHGAKNDLGYSRLGISASRRLGNAVQRNRWKRLIREAFRKHRHDLPTGLDLVVRPQPDAVPDLMAISQSLAILAQRVGRKCFPA